jgi:hypothetical protein
MTETDISSHKANIADTEQARKGDASIDKIPRNGDDSEIKDLNLAEVAGLDDEAAIPKGTIDPVYEAKARVLNHAVCTSTIYADLMLKDILQIQEIGMGWYQWQLFIVVGFGWANDNLWPIVTSLICTSYLSLNFDPSHDDLTSIH